MFKSQDNKDVLKRLMLLKSMILHSSRDDVIMTIFYHCHTVTLWHHRKYFRDWVYCTLWSL